MNRPRYDLNAIKAALPRYLERAGCEPRMQEEGKKLVSLCPLHADKTPSLIAVEKKPGLWTWYCHPCGEGGTVIDLHAKRHGIATRDAIAELGEMLDAPTLDAAPSRRPSVRSLAGGGSDADADGDRIPGLGEGVPKPPEPPKPEPLAGEAAAECNAAVAALLDDEPARIAHAEALGVSPATLAALAQSLDLGLIDGRLAYLAHDRKDWHGIQVRNRPGVDPRFFWKEGKTYLPWRGWRLKESRVRTVYLCEGQSDAIALIEAGIENPANAASKVAVIAAPGTAFPEWWATLFRFRRVILCGDRDEPGQRAVRKIGGLLYPVAESVRVFSWAALPPRLAAAGDLREIHQSLKSNTQPC